MIPASAFDADRALEHTRALCYPRRVGSVGERRAARYLARQFAALGLACRRQRFRVSHFPAEVGSRLAFAVCAALIVLGIVAAPRLPLAAVFCGLAAAVLVNAPWRVQRFCWRSWPPHTRSENLLAALPETIGDAPARVVFLAHYDTKSQWLPTGVRVALVSLASAACLLLALASLAAALGFGGLLETVGAWPLGAAVLVCLAGLALNFTGNRCPGALDNGSAVGTLLELARSWRPEPGAPVEVVWVATGSEEVELDGARHLLESQAAWWRDRPTLVINLESVGAGAFVYLAGEARGLRLARETADALGLAHARLRVLGAGMDHEPFAARGLPSVSILGDVVRRSFALHSRRDNMGIIERAALDRAGLLAAHLAWRWARLHQPAKRCVPAEPGKQASRRMRCQS